MLWEIGGEGVEGVKEGSDIYAQVDGKRKVCWGVDGILKNDRAMIDSCSPTTSALHSKRASTTGNQALTYHKNTHPGTICHKPSPLLIHLHTHQSPSSTSHPSPPLSSPIPPIPPKAHTPSTT